MAKFGIGTLFSLILMVIAGVAIFQKLWSVQLDLNEARLNKFHIQKLYNDVLDEVADWRRKYDDEVKVTQEHRQSLKQVLQKLHEKDDNITLLRADKKLLQQANEALKKEVAKLNEVLMKKKSTVDTLEKNRAL
ncbi:hypothetical protein O6H91_10G042900 [Diphasiastrum complanatum]|uniref:Uncharacterized protein n=1 Tax=Diphasiastrum complanatum TaxID=34168 RepID=A0ACC2CGK4_DIPCM|nr:hypothetical protein O6H91_10G042900 [Diphasiastrum complanatum]